MDISTFSILFIIQKGKTNQEGKAPILARITINKQMVHISTRQSVPPQRWLPKECKTIGLTKEEKQINRFLEDFKGLIYSKYKRREMYLITRSLRRLPERLCSTRRSQNEQTYL